MLVKKKDIAGYFENAQALADAVKRELIKGKNLNTETILALNRFVVSANNIQALTDEFMKFTIKTNN